MTVVYLQDARLSVQQIPLNNALHFRRTAYSIADFRALHGFAMGFLVGVFHLFLVFSTLNGSLLSPRYLVGRSLTQLVLYD